MHVVADLVGIFPAVSAGGQVIEVLLLLFHTVGNDPCLELNLAAFEEFDDLLPDNPAGNDGFGQGVAAQAVESVHVPARRFAGRIEALETVGGSVLVGANPAHAVMLGRPHRDHLGDRVDVQELVADFLHFPELGLDMLRAEMADIEPQVRAVWA